MPQEIHAQLTSAQAWSLVAAFVSATAWYVGKFFPIRKDEEEETDETEQQTELLEIDDTWEFPDRLMSADKFRESIAQQAAANRALGRVAAQDDPRGERDR
jgi:hypothetical protein